MLAAGKFHAGTRDPPEREARARAGGPPPGAGGKKNSPLLRNLMDLFMGRVKDLHLSRVKDAIETRGCRGSGSGALA